MALMNNYDYFKENVDVAKQSSGTLEKQSEIYAESWEAAEKRVRAAAEGIYQDLIDDKFFISLNNGFADILSGLSEFIDKAGGLKTIIIGLSGVLLANFSKKIPEAIAKIKYNFNILTKGSEKAYQNILNQMNESSQKSFDEYRISGGKKGINEDSSTGLAIKQANQLSVARMKYYNIEDKLTDAEKQRYQMQLQLIEAAQKEIQTQAKKNEEIQKTIALEKQRLDNKTIEVNRKAMSNGLDQASNVVRDLAERKQQILQKAHGQRGQQNKGNVIYSNAIDEAENFYNYLNDYKNKLSAKYTEIHKVIMSNFSNGEFNKNAASIQLFEKLDFKNPTSEIEAMVNSMEALASSQIDSTDKLNSFQEQVGALSAVIDPAIQEATGLDSVFRKLGQIQDPSKLKDGIQNLKDALTNAAIPATEFEKIIRSWDGKSIEDLINKFQDLKVGIEEVHVKGNQLKTDVDSFNPESVIKVSEAFADLAGGIMNCYNILNSVQSILRAINNEDLSKFEKFGAILSGSSMLMMSFNSLGKQTSTLGKFLGGVVTKLTATSIASGTAGKAITLLGSTAGKVAAGGIAALGTGLIAIGLAAGALILVFTTIKKIYDASPEGQLKKITKAAEEAKTAAEEAATAYEDLSNAFDSYDNAINKLDDLEKGTQSFVDALEDANTQAWELIKKYNLIKSEDWKIGDNGEIIITEQGRGKSQNEAYSNKLSTQSVANALALMQSKQEVEVAESKLNPITYNDTAGTYQSPEEIIKALTNNGLNSLEQTKKEWQDAKFSQDEGKQNEILSKYGRALFGNLDGDIGKVNSERTRNILDGYLDKLIDYRNINSQYNRDLEAYGGQNIQSILNGNQAYQNSSYKNEIFDKVSEEYAQKLADAEEKWNNETDANKINTAFNEAIGDNYEIRENGDVINKTTHQKDEYYSGLSDEQKKQIIAAQEANLETNKSATELAESFNNVTEGFSKSDKEAFSKLRGNLSEEDYKNLKGLSGDDLLNSLGFSEESIKKLKDTFGDSFTGWLDDLSDQIKNYDPTQFNLEAWQENYENQLAAAEKISDSGIIKDKDFNELNPELQGFFENLQNGTHILTISADEFNQKIRELSQQDLKKSIDNSIQAIQNGVQAYGDTVGRKNVDSSFLTNTAQSMLNNPLFYSEDSNAYRGMLAAVGPEVIEGLDTTEERIKAVAQAWLDLINGLENKKTALASSIGNIQELDAALENNEITLENYNKAFNTVLAADAKTNGIDYSEIENYTKALIKANSNLEDNIQLAQKMSLAYLKVEKGTKKISSSFSDWNKAIKNSKKDITQYLRTVDEIRDAYKQVFNTINPKVIDNLSNEFLTSAKTMDLMNKAINGSEQDWNNWEAAVLAEVNNTSNAFSSMTQDMKNQMTELTTMAANLDFSGLVPGADIDDAPFIAKLNEMIFSTADAAAAMSDNLSSVGVDAEIVPHTVTVPASTKLTTQNGFLVGTDANGGIINIPVSAQVQETDDAKTYTWYTLKGAKYNGRGVRPASAAPAKSGGGGGGSKSHANSKNYTDKDRYHTIKNQIEDLSAEYDDLNDAKDRAFGKNRLKYMDQEIAKTDELIRAQKEYLHQIENNLPTDRAIMEKAYNEYIGGPGIQYDEKGNISNFDTIQDAMFNKYNDMATSYTDDSNEWKVFEKKYELLEKYIEQYEETYDLLRDQRQELQDLINQKIDLGLEQVQYSVEVKLDIPDDKIKFLEYRLGRIDDDAFKSVEAVTLLTKKADEVYKKIQINKEALNDVLKLSMSVGEITQILAGNTSVLARKTFTEEQINALKEYRDNLLDLNSELDDIRSNIEDKVMTAFDAWKEKLDSGISTIEHYGNVLQSYRNIVDIVGKDTLGITGEFMNNLAQGTVDNAIDKLKGTKKNYETIINARDEASKKLAEAEAQRDEASVKMWKDTLDQINEEVESSNEEMMQAWEDALSGIAEQFENAMNDLIDKFNDSVYALGGLDALNDDFSRQQENADLMLDDYQKIYELSKLSRDINKTIDDTDIISGKQKLKKLLGQINDLQEDGNEMSKYDLEYLQKTYDLRLAEIELEEAQRAKNTVRLQKDSEGNWSYIYTQSSDAIDSAQQKYEDALYAMQDLSSNYIDEMSEKLISTSKDMEDALAAIRIQDYASIDDYYAAVKKVQDQYQEQLDIQQNELQKALDNNKQLYDEDWKNYHDATGYKISDMEDFATKFKDTMLGALLGSESDTANFNDLIKDSVYNLTLGLQQAAETYYENLEKAMQAAGTSTKDFAEDASESIEQVVQDSQKGTDAVNNMADQMKTAFGEITNSVSSWQENYSKNMEAIIESNLKVIKSFNDMLESLSINPDSITVKYDIANAAKDQDIDSYDSGGYTGNWGTAGKLAVLHQKEIVLNADDTANMLAAVQITRAMLETIDLNARQASLGLGNLVASGIKEEKTETLQQEVKITAEFPNVQNHSEIEEAFNNLINQASQYANRK